MFPRFKCFVFLNCSSMFGFLLFSLVNQRPPPPVYFFYALCSGQLWCHLTWFFSFCLLVCFISSHTVLHNPQILSFASFLTFSFSSDSQISSPRSFQTLLIQSLTATVQICYHIGHLCPQKLKTQGGIFAYYVAFLLCEVKGKIKVCSRCALCWLNFFIL